MGAGRDGHVMDMTQEQALILLIYEACRRSQPSVADKLLADAMMLGAKAIEQSMGVATIPADAPDPIDAGGTADQVELQAAKPPRRRK